MDDEDDIEAALSSARAGDLAPVGRVLEHFRPRLTRMVELRLSPLVRARLDAHDVLQEAFVEIVERVSEYTPGRGVSFYVWARFLVAQRVAQLHRRNLVAQGRDARREQAAPPSSMAIASAFLDRGPTPSRAAIGRERQRALVQALESLRDVDREVLCMRHFEELPNRDVARILGLSEQAASVRHTRALRRLRSALDGLGLDSGGVT